MARLVLVLGQSGSGKSASLRNFPENEYSFFNTLGKPLPFKSKKKFLETTDYAKLKQALLASSQTERDAMIIDDAGYLITEQFMKGHGGGKGNQIFELYNALADNFYGLLRFIVGELPKDKTVYVFMHEDTDEFGNVKPKTIGKLLDEKVNIAGLFTIILHAKKIDGKYQFRTQSDGSDVTKSPMGMFDSEYIENDLYEVNKAIKSYYTEAE